MKNVLSIDMDYILAPCINLYNDLSRLEDPKKIWDNINNLRSIDGHLKYDENKLFNIMNIFTKVLFKNPADIMFAINHDAILYKLSSKEYKNEKITLYNIDHHHDINYTDEQISDVDKYDYTSISTWVWYLDKYKLLDKYIWIKNENSYAYCGPKLDARFEEFTDITESDLQNQDIDFIFVCQSPQWIPRSYDHFFYIMKTIAENYLQTNIDLEYRNFCEGNIGRRIDK